LQVLDPLVSSEFYGAAVIDVDVIKETDTITLHAKDLTLDVETQVQYETTDGDIKEVPIVDRITDEEHEMIHFKLESSLSENSSYQIRIPQFVGKVRNGGFGYSRILAESYGDDESYVSGKPERLRSQYTL